MNESFDDEFYVVSLYAEDVEDILEGRTRHIYLNKRLTMDWLKRHSYIALCS